MNNVTVLWTGPYGQLNYRRMPFMHLLLKSPESALVDLICSCLSDMFRTCFSRSWWKCCRHCGSASDKIPRSVSLLRNPLHCNFTNERRGRKTPEGSGAKAATYLMQSCTVAWTIACSGEKAATKREEGDLISFHLVVGFLILRWTNTWWLPRLGPYRHETKASL